MNFKTKIREIWHDIYYFLFSNKGDKFAMHCKEVTHQVDLKFFGLNLKDKFRAYLHLSLCQACSNHHVFSRFLSKNLRKFIHNNKTSSEKVEKLNSDLIKKYTRP